MFVTVLLGVMSTFLESDDCKYPHVYLFYSCTCNSLPALRVKRIFVPEAKLYYSARLQLTDHSMVSVKLHIGI